MSVRRQIVAAAIFGLAVLANCSVLVDTSDIAGDCRANEKPCNGHCVRIDDPEFGCTPTGCDACKYDIDESSTVVSVCAAGVCKAQCPYGFGCTNCKYDLLTDPEHCGGCNVPPCGADENCVCGRCRPKGEGGEGGDGSKINCHRP